MAETYIKTYRKCLDNEIFRERPFDRWHAFEYLLLRAQRFPADVLIKGKTVHLDTGQLIEGEENLAEKWGWSRGKVRRFITLLINKGMIAKNGTPSGTVITIENYTFYQCGEPADDTSNGTTDGTTDGTHKKKVKKEKKVKNNIIRHKHGTYDNVLLSDEDFTKLINEFPMDYKERIERLSEYMKSTGKSYKDHLATIRNWARREKKPKPRNEVLEILESGVLDD